MSLAEQPDEQPQGTTYILHIQPRSQQFTFTITNQHTGEETQFSSLLKAFEYLERQFRPSFPNSLR